MLFRSLLEGLLSPTARRRRRATPLPGAFRPDVETLEDRLTPAAMLAMGDVTILEGNTGTQNALVNVSLTEPHGNSVTVNYNTAAGTAVAGSDYTAVSGKLTFAKNEMSKSIIIPIKGDRLVESDEYFTVHLSNPKGAKIVRGQGYVTILDNEPRTSINDPSVVEGDSGTAPLTFTVSLSAPYDLPVAVNYTVTDGTATAGSDYTAAPAGALTFAPGQTSQTITVAVIGDRLAEQNETVLVNLSTPDSYAAISKGVGVGTIIDNEPHISIYDAWQDYYGTSITFTVTLAAAYDEVVTVDFTTVDGTALAGVDYFATSGTLTFNPGETTLTITVALIATDPADKYFYIQLSNASANALLMNEWAAGYWYYDYGYWGGGGWYDYGWYDSGYYW